MIFEQTPLKDVLIVNPDFFKDNRGFFFESYHSEKFRSNGIDTEWVQDNHSGSVKNTLRGLHFQRGDGQAKLVRCIVGEIWDVVVDMRPGSPSFRNWHSVILSQENHQMLFVPEGFAHGYAVLSNWAEVVYKCGSLYNPQTEDGIMWNDPDLSVRWPIADPLLSDRDLSNQSFRSYCRKMGIQSEW